MELKDMAKLKKNTRRVHNLIGIVEGAHDYLIDLKWSVTKGAGKSCLEAEKLIREGLVELKRVAQELEKQRLES